MEKPENSRSCKIMLDVKLCETFSELAESSDILLSTVVPAEAVNVAKDVGRNFKGLYVI
jgi:hypothetical protein